MKFLNWMSLLTSILLLSGCADIQAPSKYAEKNTIYSSKIPQMNITIDDVFTFANEKRAPQAPVGEEKSGQKKSVMHSIYYYHNQENDRGIKIQFSNMLDRRWHFSQGKYNSRTAFSISSILLNGQNYMTRIRKVTNKCGTYLEKQYHSTFSGHCRLNIYYWEKLEQDIEKSEHLSNEDNEYLTAFEKRADASFSILPYSPKQ